jgi:hypothetical protein
MAEEPSHPNIGILEKEVGGMGRRKDSAPEIDQELQAHIGRHLKAAYDDILNQSVPDRFLSLLEQLTDKDEPASETGAEKGSK